MSSLVADRMELLMPYTVTSAFQTFQSHYVDLEKGDVDRARTSRNFLEGQLTNLPGKVANFPPLYGSFMYFGSFSRKTKIRPLDDIDLMLLLDGKNTSVVHWSGYTYLLRITDQNSPLWQYRNDGDYYLNSTKVLNKIKSSLSQVQYYRNSDVKRNGVAVVLDLTSYPWVFDIVPAFPVDNGLGGVAHYLIPDGNGKWMRTDPRIDQATITIANQTHNGNLLPLMRIMKYWNTHHYATRKLSSYYLETLLITAFRYYPAITSLRLGKLTAFQQLATLVMGSCPDPKGLGPNLDASVPWETKVKVQEQANQMAQNARYALNYEQQSNDAEAVKWWKFIFYPDFPTYGP